MQSLKLTVPYLLVAVLIILCPQNIQADPLDFWHWRNPLPQGNSLTGIAFGNGIYVAVGEYGTILTSPDGMAWMERDSGTTNRLFAVAYGNGVFVVLGDEGTLMTSVDGVSWIDRSFDTIYFFYGVSFCGGMFITSRTDGVILTSLDGVTWTERDHYFFKSVTYGNGLFVGISAFNVITSSDGIAWVKKDLGILYDMKAIAFGNDTFVSVGEDGASHGKIVTSQDGTIWNDSGVQGYVYPLTSIVYGAGIFVAVGKQGAIYTSADGLTWTQTSMGGSSQFDCVTYGDGRFVAAGVYGAILLSSDGNSWTEGSSGSRADLLDIHCAKDRCIAVGQGETILTSLDGISWNVTFEGNPACPLNSIRYGAGVYVAVGGCWSSEPTSVLFSRHGLHWTRIKTGTFKTLQDVTYGNGKFVAVGNRIILTSLDGLNWVKSIGTWPTLRGVAYGNGIYVAVGIRDPGQRSVIFTSTDGVTWQSRNVPATSSEFYRITYGNGLFVIVGSGGIVVTSRDGITWRKRDPGSHAIDFYDVVYRKGTFVAVGTRAGGMGGGVFTSSDGKLWGERILPTLNSLNGAAYGNSGFLIVGKGGTILQSDPVD